MTLPVIGTYGTEEPDLSAEPFLGAGSLEAQPSNRQTTTHKDEFRIISQSAFPLAFTTLLQYSINTISILAVGHIGEKELAAVSLANVTFILASSTFIGMSTCLDSLCPQAYGAGKYELVGAYLQRSVALSFVIAIPTMIFFFFSGSLLQFIVPEPILADMAQSYLRVISLGLPGYILFENGKRFLQAQGNFKGGQYSLILCAPLTIILNFALVFHFNYGLIGSAMAVGLNYWFMTSVLFIYIIFVDGKQCWYGLDIAQCIRGWGTMLKLAWPSIVMIQAEFFAFEILTLSCSFFGTTALAAQSVVASSASLAFQIPFASSVAASTRIGNLIGANCKSAAKVAVNITIVFAMMTALFNFSLFFFLRFRIANLFTSDPEVAAKAAWIFPVIALNQLPDCLNIHCAGIFRAQGRQKIGGYLNIICYYTISIPLALFFGFKLGFEVRGLWSGLMIGIIVLASLSLHFIRKSDWESIVKSTLERQSLI